VRKKRTGGERASCGIGKTGAAGGERNLNGEEGNRLCKVIILGRGTVQFGRNATTEAHSPYYSIQERQGRVLSEKGWGEKEAWP